MTDRKPLLFVGPFPGPVTGQTVMTQFLYDDLVRIAGQGAVRRINIVRGDTGNTIGNLAVKLARAARACASILLRGHGTVCYISLDANRGMRNTLAYARCARLVGADIVIHHHSQGHIDADVPTMTQLAKVAGPDATHVCICETMAAELQARYPAVRKAAALSNIISLSALDGHVPDPTTLRLGHMSKLSFDKGLREVVAVAEGLKKAGVPVTLTLAGKCENAAAQDFVDAAKTRLGTALTIAGPVYDEAKTTFLRHLDVFLFPTRYANETQGIVNLEALSVGAPVVAFGRGCIRDDLAGLANWVVATDGDYVGHTVAFLTAVQADPAQMENLRKLATQRFAALKADNASQIAAFRNLCLGTADG